MKIESHLPPQEMPVNWELFREGIFSFSGVTITRETRAEEIRELIGQEKVGGSYHEMGENGAVWSTFAILETYIVHNDVAVQPMLYFTDDGSLRKLDMMPKGKLDAEASYYKCWEFLRPLIGRGNVARFPWGEVTTWLEPDYHDDWHGGDIYITFNRQGG